MEKTFTKLVCDRCERPIRNGETYVKLDVLVGGEQIVDIEELCPRCVKSVKSSLHRWVNMVRYTKSADEPVPAEDVA